MIASPLAALDTSLVRQIKRRIVTSNTHTVADSGQSAIFIENTEEYLRLEAAFEALEMWENAA